MDVLRGVGGDGMEGEKFEEEEVQVVGRLVRKEGLGKKVGGEKGGEEEEEEEVQILEDAACLVFLDDQYKDFREGILKGKEKVEQEDGGSIEDGSSNGEKAGGGEEKMIGILKKTWGKMSEKGREVAVRVVVGGMDDDEEGKKLIGRALGG